MEPQPEGLPSETIAASLGLQACDAIRPTRRRSGEFSQRSHSVLEQIALARYPSFLGQQAAVYPSNIQHMTPQHPAFRHSAKCHELSYTSALSPSASSTMLSGTETGTDFIHSGNCYDTARCSSMGLLPPVAAHRQQSLTEYTYKTDDPNECFYAQLSQNNTRSLRSSIGFADLAASHDTQCGQLQKCLPVQGPRASCSMAQITSNALAVKKRKDKTSPIASSTLQRGRPKRALTAYNLFFKDFREQILADRQKYRFSADNRGCKHDKRKRGCDSKMHHGVCLKKWER